MFALLNCNAHTHKLITVKGFLVIMRSTRHSYDTDTHYFYLYTIRKSFIKNIHFQLCLTAPLNHIHYRQFNILYIISVNILQNNLFCVSYISLMRLEDVLILGGIFVGKYSAIEEVKIISDGQIGFPRDIKTF